MQISPAGYGVINAEFSRQSRRLDILLREFLEAADLRSEHWHRRNETASLSGFVVSLPSGTKHIMPAAIPRSLKRFVNECLANPVTQIFPR